MDILDEKKMTMIDLLLIGTMSKVDIAKTLGISRQTLYEWAELDIVKVEMDKRRQDLQSSRRIADNIYLTHVLEIINDYRKFMKSTTNQIAKVRAMEYWQDRALGRMVNKIESNTNEDKESPIGKDKLAAEFDSNEQEDNNE